MTNPDRSISGLAPRRRTPDASRLIAANRPASGVTSPATSSEPEPSTSVEPEGTPGRAATQSSPDENPTTTVKVSIYLPRGLRKAAVAAFKATAHLEGDQSWSDMIEKAVRAEVLRRQEVYNKGQVFPGGEGKLTPGRSVSA